MTSDNNVSLRHLVLNVLYLLALIAVAMIVKHVIDRVLLGYVWIGVGRPNFETPYLIRTVLGAITALFLFLFVIVNNPVPQVVPLSRDVPSSPALWPWVTLSSRARQISLIVVLLFSLAYLAVFFDDPTRFRDLSSDEKLVENLSAVFSFVAFIIFLIIGFVLRKLGSEKKSYAFYPAVSWFFALLFFVICMEEIAWMQGVLFFDTPDFFMDNAQGETNFHNYSTFKFELAYYYSTFLFFIVVPFFYNHRSTLARTPLISHFLPSRFMLYIGAMAAAYNYDMWNDLYFQMCFFLTLYMLIYYVWMQKSESHRVLLSLLIVVFFVSQLSFVFYGYRVTRTPSFKEYKEFFIPLTFLLYSCEIFVRSRKLKRQVKSK